MLCRFLVSLCSTTKTTRQTQLIYKDILFSSMSMLFLFCFSFFNVNAVFVLFLSSMSMLFLFCFSLQCQCYFCSVSLFICIFIFVYIHHVLLIHSLTTHIHHTSTSSHALYDQSLCLFFLPQGERERERERER